MDFYLHTITQKRLTKEALKKTSNGSQAQTQDQETPTKRKTSKRCHPSKNTEHEGKGRQFIINIL